MLSSYSSSQNINLLTRSGCIFIFYLIYQGLFPPVDYKWKVTHIAVLSRFHKRTKDRRIQSVEEAPYSSATHRVATSIYHVIITVIFFLGVNKRICGNCSQGYRLFVW